jgi:Zn-dependent protease with chaperone function
MTPALLVFLYALAVAWYSPALLRPLTLRGDSARLGIAAWLTAMISTLVSAAVALQFLVRAAIAGWSRLAEAFCRTVTRGACGPQTYRNAIFELALGAAALIAAVAVLVLAWRYGRRLQQGRRRTQIHGECARMTGRGLPGARAVVVLDEPQPVAYCVAGRPATIVVTSGALAVLDGEQLAAVLAHEQAHLAGRHHLLIALTRGLAATFPAVPLFTQGPDEIARLAEMCADDSAARTSGRHALLAALLAMGTGMAVPTTALAAAAFAVAARVERLLEPPSRTRHTACRLTLVAVTATLVLVSGLVTMFAGSLVAHGITLS